MTYNKIPKSLKELNNLKLKYIDEIIPLYNFIIEKYKIKDPFAIDLKHPKSIKVTRQLQYKLDIKKYNKMNKNIKFSFGEGSRGNRGSNNRGNLFETELYNEIMKYVETGETKDTTVKELIKLVPNGGYLSGASLDGGLNQKRPLKIGSNIIVGEGGGDIGATVTDITLFYTKNNKKFPIYLSLKMGGTVSLVNAGVKKIFTEKEMKEGMIKNEQGKKLLNLFGIDNKKFCNIFNSYTGQGSSKETVDVKGLIDKSLFKTFMESVIGYNFVLVHKMTSKTYIINMTKAKMQNFIKLKSATAIYPTNGSNKRIDIKIEMNGMEIIVNIRNTGGKIYPSHLLVNYKIYH